MLFWFNFILTNTCQLSYCAATIDQTSLSLKVALQARENKIERQFANRDLVNSYGVVESFIKNLFIVSLSII